MNQDVCSHCGSPRIQRVERHDARTKYRCHECQQWSLYPRTITDADRTRAEADRLVQEVRNGMAWFGNLALILLTIVGVVVMVVSFVRDLGRDGPAAVWTLKGLAVVGLGTLFIVLPLTIFVIDRIRAGLRRARAAIQAEVSGQNRIPLSCGCGHRWAVHHRHAGTRVKCPQCRTGAIVPKPDPDQA